MIFKLLSHRVRGFSETENSHNGFSLACKSAVPYLEIDVRVCADGKFIVHHDPVFKCRNGLKHKIFLYTLEDISALRYPDGERLLSLRDALEYFSARNHELQKLCIDIKDYGYEEEILQLVREYSLEENIIFVSWIPQTLTILSEAGSSSPLILSHFSILRLGKAGRVFSRVIQDISWRFSHLVLMGRNRIKDGVINSAIGFQHSLICAELPEKILQVIKESRGGLCIHHSLVNKHLLEYCDKSDLRLWIYTVNDVTEFKKFTDMPGIDVIFSDDAPMILEQL